MARINIRRDRTGGPVQPAAPGENSRVVVAHVTYPDALAGYVSDPTHANRIWETAWGHAAVHQSTRLSHPPQGYSGYIHSHDNVLFAISRIDVARGTIELVGGPGHVNSGRHCW